MPGSEQNQRDPMSTLPHMSAAFDPRDAPKGRARQDESAETEGEYLSRQAGDARAAISQMTEEIARGLARGADPRAWVQHYPWATVAAAMAAGFAAATLFPSREERALKKLVEVENALGIGQARDKRGARADDPADNGRRGQGTSGCSRVKAALLGGLARQALEILKPVVMSALTEGLTAKTSPPPSANIPPRGHPGSYAQDGTGPSNDTSGGI